MVCSSHSDFDERLDGLVLSEMAPAHVGLLVLNALISCNEN